MRLEIDQFRDAFVLPTSCYTRSSVPYNATNNATNFSDVGEVRMRYRTFGRMGWEVSEIGYGMWGMGSWANSNDDESLASLQAAVDLGCNFFDTAFAYGEGHSENLLGQTVR